MRSNSVEGDLRRVCYGWSAGEGWHAPDHPRIELAGYPYLYKLDVTAEAAATAQAGEGIDPCREFLDVFLPALQPYLASPSG